MPHAILEWSVRAALMAFAIAAVLAILRLRAPSAVHRAWTAVLFAMLLLPVWTTWGPSWSAPILPAGAPVRLEPLPPLAEIPTDVESPPAISPTPAHPAPAPAPIRWTAFLLPIYLVGAAIMLTRLIAATLLVRTLGRNARTARGFLTSPLCAAPVTMGWFRLAIVLPESCGNWPSAKLDAVLIHEREHAWRRDPLIQWLALLNRALFWFHPLAWWLERRLAALAEQSCDAAVLEHGHDPHEYSRYLVEPARSVTQSGARLCPAGAVAFSQGQLSGRIRAMLSGRPPGRASRFTSIAAAALSAIALAAFMACRPTPSRRVDAKPHVGQRRARDSDLWLASRQLTPEAARHLHAEIEAHPDDRDKLFELVRYYQFHSDQQSLDSLTFWYIGNHADLRAGWGYRPLWNRAWDAAGYDRGKRLWLARLKRHGRNAFLYMNASEFLEDHDPEQSEQLLLEGQRAFPSPALHWEVLLARHYAWALTGATGPLPDSLHAAGYDYRDMPPIETPYAKKIRALLLSSDDVELLTRAVEQLQRNRPNIDFVKSLMARARALDPPNRAAHLQNFGHRLYAAGLRAGTNPAAASDSDRMLSLAGRMTPRALINADIAATEASARDLLALASRLKSDPDAGAGIYLAHLALGEVAMNRGDKPAAARYLLAAAGAPTSEYTRYDQADMSLARELLDAGDRETVARYLDRCATFQPRPAHWAAEIRQGKNPDLMPVFRPFRRGLAPTPGKLPRIVPRPFLLPVMHAQTPAAAFEVAPIKPNKTGARDLPSTSRPTARKIFLGMLIQRAYGLDEVPFTRPTPPVFLERYDIDAKSARPATHSEMMLMVQNVLAERFRLASTPTPQKSPDSPSSWPEPDPVCAAMSRRRIPIAAHAVLSRASLYTKTASWLDFASTRPVTTMAGQRLSWAAASSPTKRA